MMFLGWVWLRAVILGKERKFSVLGFSSSSSASSSSLSSFFNFSLIIYMNLYMGLMNLDIDLERFWWFCGVSVMILGWVFRWIWTVFGLGLLVGLSWFWVGFSNCFSVDFVLIFCARWRWVWWLDGYFLLPSSYPGALSCCRRWERALW